MTRLKKRGCPWLCEYCGKGIEEYIAHLVADKPNEFGLYHRYHFACHTKMTKEKK